MMATVRSLVDRIDVVDVFSVVWILTTVLLGVHVVGAVSGYWALRGSPTDWLVGIGLIATWLLAAVAIERDPR